MLKQLTSLALIALIVGSGVYVVINPPHLSGPRLKLRSAPVQSIELSTASTSRVITASNLCQDVLLTIQRARAGGVIHDCPIIGTLTLHYELEGNESFELMPGHGFNEMDLIKGGTCYRVSRARLSAVLKRAGLML